MLLKSVIWKLGGIPGHDPIPCDFGDNARCCNAEGNCIAFDDRSLWKRKRMHRQSVNQNVVRDHTQPANCAPHGLMRGAQDIDPVDFWWLAPRDGILDLRVRRDRSKRQLTRPAGKFF